MSADAYTPLFFNYTMPFKTQKPLLNTTMEPLPKMGSRIHNNKPTVFLRLLCFGFGCSPARGASFPSTSSIPHKIPDMEQQTEWYSLPNGCGFLGTNILPGHVYLFVHGLMLSSRHETHDGVNCCAIFLFHSSNRKYVQVEGLDTSKLLVSTLDG